MAEADGQKHHRLSLDQSRQTEALAHILAESMQKGGEEGSAVLEAAVQAIIVARALLLSSIGLTASIAAVSGGVHRVAGVSGTGLAAFGISALIACHAWWHGGLGRDGPRGGGSSACGAARRSVIAVAAAVILVSAAAARDASTPGNSLCEEDLRRGQNRDRCASELAWTLGTAIGSCAWVLLRVPLREAVVLEASRQTVLAAVRLCNMRVHHTLSGAVGMIAEHTTILALVILIIVAVTETVPIEMRRATDAVFRLPHLRIARAASVAAGRLTEARTALLGRLVLDPDTLPATVIVVTIAGVVAGEPLWRTLRYAVGTMFAVGTTLTLLKSNALTQRLARLVGRVQMDHAHGVLRHLMTSIQDCADEQELLDKAISLLKLLEPRALLAALGTFTRLDPKRSGDDAQRGEGPLRRVERAAVRGGSVGVLQDLKRIVQVSAGRLSFAHLLLSDSSQGFEDWTADSDITEGGIQAFADWSLASAAIYERRGPGARKHRPPRAVTMPLSGGPEVLGFLMLIIDDSKADASDLAMVRQFRDCVGMCLQGIRSRKSAARETAEREQLKMQRRFLNSMSHELRTPLNAVMGLTALCLEEPDLPPQIHDYLTTSLGSSVGLLNIISQMLEYARFDGVAPVFSGQKVLEPQLVDVRFDLSTLGEELADVLAAKAIQGGCELIVDVEPIAGRLVLKGDNKRLRQCITLLADNAFKHGAAMGEVVVGVTLADLREERGHAAVERRSTEPSDGRTWFELSVADGGFVGPEVQERMFLPFEQETPEGGVKPSGIGLGLPMAQAIIARMGGRITCVSIEGTGTKFKVLVPFTVAERSQKPISFSMPLPTAARISVSVSRPVLSATMVSWVRQWGADSVCETRLDDALTEPKPGVVIVEFHILKGMIMLSSRKLLAARYKRLIVLGRFADRAELGAVWPAAVESFVAKPVKASQLLEVILQQLARLTEPGGAPLSAVVADVSEVPVESVASATSSLSSARSLPHRGTLTGLPTQQSSSTSRSVAPTTPRGVAAKRSFRRPCTTEPIVLSAESAALSSEACMASTPVPMMLRAPMRPDKGRRTHAMAFRQFAALRSSPLPAKTSTGAGVRTAGAAGGHSLMTRSASVTAFAVPPGWGGGGLSGGDCYGLGGPSSFSGQPRVRGGSAASSFDSGSRPIAETGAADATALAPSGLAPFSGDSALNGSIMSEDAEAELAEVAARARESLRLLPKRQEASLQTTNAILRWSKRKQGAGMGFRQSSCQDFASVRSKESFEKPRPDRQNSAESEPWDVIEQTRASSLPNAGMEALSRDALGPSSSQRTSVASIGHGSSAHGDGDGIDEGCGVSSSGGASVSQRQRAASIGSRRSSSPGARRRSRENNGTALFPPRGQVSQQRALVEGTVVEATPEEESGGPQQERELQPGSAKLAGFFMGASNRHPLALRLINEPVVLAESVSAMPALGGHARGLAAFELAQQALRASGRGLSLDGREKMLPLSHIQHSSGLHISDLSPVSRGNPRGHRFSLECLHVESAARKDVSDGTANKASRSNSLEGQRAPQPGKRWSAEPSALGTVSTSGQSGRELPSAIHVLLAEDNKVNQLVAKAVLGRCGATCVVANDGLEALMVIKEGQLVDIVFMDLDMPNLNGLESTRRIREFELMVGTPRRNYIVALTAHTSEEDRADCTEAGMDSFMTKPITPAMVRDEIMRWKQTQGKQAEPAADAGDFPMAPVAGASRGAGALLGQAAACPVAPFSVAPRSGILANTSPHVVRAAEPGSPGLAPKATAVTAETVASSPRGETVATLAPDAVAPASPQSHRQKVAPPTKRISQGGYGISLRGGGAAATKRPSARGDAAGSSARRVSMPISSSTDDEMMIMAQCTA